MLLFYYNKILHVEYFGHNISSSSSFSCFCPHRTLSSELSSGTPTLRMSSFTIHQQSSSMVFLFSYCLAALYPSTTPAFHISKAFQPCLSNSLALNLNKINLNLNKILTFSPLAPPAVPPVFLFVFLCHRLQTINERRSNLQTI